MQKILISSCLLGEKVKYNGGDNFVNSIILKLWQDEGRLVPICPELAGGLPVPRNPVEIQNGEGSDVLAGGAKAIDSQQNDVTSHFIQGAQAALALARTHHITIAILKARSPSCGSQTIYDGSFSGKLKAGLGITARLLEQNNIHTFNESQLAEVQSILDKLDY